MKDEMISAEIVDKLYSQIDLMIVKSKTIAAHAVNNAMVLLYWHIGESLFENVLATERAEYGESIIDEISQKLYLVYGKGIQ